MRRTKLQVVSCAKGTLSSHDCHPLLRIARKHVENLSELVVSRRMQGVENIRPIQCDQGQRTFPLDLDELVSHRAPSVLFQDVDSAGTAQSHDMSEANTGTLDLACARCPAQMRRHFVQVGNSRSAQGMSL